MEREEIISMASQVGREVKNSEIMSRFELAYNAFIADKELQDKLSEYTSDQDALTKTRDDSVQADENVVKALSDRIIELYSDITHNDNFEIYQKAQAELRSLLDDVSNAMLNAASAGIKEGDSGCTGDCSHCGGGCH